jgi:hypothetical protein
MTSLDLGDPEMSAEHLLGTVYSTATVVQPHVPTELLLNRFREVGGSLAQYEAGLRFALTAGWLVLDKGGIRIVRRMD